MPPARISDSLCQIIKPFAWCFAQKRMPVEEEPRVSWIQHLQFVYVLAIRWCQSRIQDVSVSGCDDNPTSWREVLDVRNSEVPWLGEILVMRNNMSSLGRFFFMLPDITYVAGFCSITFNQGLQKNDTIMLNTSANSLWKQHEDKQHCIETTLGEFSTSLPTSWNMPNVPMLFLSCS